MQIDVDRKDQMYFIIIVKPDVDANISVFRLQ